MGKKSKQDIQKEIDAGTYGRPLQYDKNFLGPRAKRSCTDIICLLLFFIFLVAWIVVGSIAFAQGDPQKIIAPFDSFDNQCGVTPGFENRKYLVYFDITKCKRGEKITCDTQKICVENCPSEFFWYQFDDKHLQPNKSLCIPSVTPPDDRETLKEHVDNGRCAAWYIPTRSLARRCVRVYRDDVDEEIYKLFEEQSKIPWGTITDGSEAAQIIAQTKSIGKSIVSELGKDWPYLVGGFALAMAFCMVYILIMRWFAWVIIWFTLFAVMGLLGYCIYASWANYQDVKNDSENFDLTDVDSVLSLKITWIIFFIASIIVLVVVLLMVLFLRNRIRIATALVGEASRAVGSITSTLFFPLGPWIIQLGIIAWTIAVWIYISSSTVPVFRATGIRDPCQCEDISNNDQCEPSGFNVTCTGGAGCEVSCTFSGFEDRAYVTYFHIINIFGFFWILCFVSAFSDMALAGTFSTWYWTFKKSDVPFFALTQSVGRTMRYHLGTLAFGSLILAICRLIRVVLEAIDQTLRKYNNGCTKALLCCMKCFFWCLEKFIKFINRNAYIMCAIHGKNFCRSAHKSFNLLMRNILRVFVLDKITDFLFLLGKLTVTAAMVILAVHIFSTTKNIDNDYDVPEYTYYLLPVIIIGIGTYFVASIFFSVYAMAVDTLFLCFLEDLERNDGSTDRPYYMSKRLMKILGKKNKKYLEKVE